MFPLCEAWSVRPGTRCSQLTDLVTTHDGNVKEAAFFLQCEKPAVEGTNKSLTLVKVCKVPTESLAPAGGFLSPGLPLDGPYAHGHEVPRNKVPNGKRRRWPWSLNPPLSLFPPLASGPETQSLGPNS